jgi:C-terminal domain on Strawberry notch homologue/P-loop containing NTP hydrolase pore-1
MAERHDENLVQAFATFFQEGGDFASILAARKYAANVLNIAAIAPATSEAKLTEESLEQGLTRAAQQIAQTSETSEQAFDRMVDLYQRQPNLSARSTTSIKDQAYSTPVPLSYLASTLAGISSDSLVYEPTAGNGSLLVAANPDHAIVNEINPSRAADLRAQGHTVTENDASTYLPAQKVDAVIMNPPFGTVREEGVLKEWTVRGGAATPAYKTTQIDHAIALHSLKAMKDDGRAVLILGAPLAQKTGNQESASTTYNARQNVAFWLSLYRNYNVTQHFTVTGNLYVKQGTSFPVDVVVIEGRGRSTRPLPAVELPTPYRSFEALKELLPHVSLLPQRPSLDAEERESNGLTTDLSSRAGVTRRDPQSEHLSRSANGSSGLDDSELDADSGDDSGGDISNDSIAGESIALSDRPTESGRFDLGLGTSADGDELSTSGGDGIPEPIGSELGAVDGISQPTADRAGGNRPGVDDNPTDQPSRMAGADARPLPQSSADSELKTSPLPDRVFPAPFTAQTTYSPISGESLMAGEPIPVQEEVKSQVAYQPQSKGIPGDTLIPFNMASSVKVSLERLDRKVGSIDQFVNERVGLSDMKLQPLAEQIDSVGMAINNLEQGEAFILGDQTGIGKGLQLAMMSKAFLSGNVNLGENVKTLVFATYTPKLYADFLRDLSDAGLADVKPLVTNSGFTLKMPNGTELKTPDGKTHNAALEALGQDNLITGTLGEYNVVFTTYSQMQTVEKSETARRNFLRDIAPNSLFIFDESHNAGGTQAAAENRKFGEPPNRSDFVRSLVHRAGGVVFSSATYAKNPYTMTLYASRTGMRHAVEKNTSFVDMVQSGGVPLQQVLASKLVESGTYLRRERSYEGVEIGAKVSPVNTEVAENISTIMSRIMEFDEAKQSAVKGIDRELKKEGKTVSRDGSTGGAGATSTNFTSLMHNVINQTLLSLKAEATVQETLQALRNGEKPVITLANTMGSTIGAAAEDQGLKTGDPIELSVGDLLKRYLVRSRDVTEKEPFGGGSTRRPLTDGELSPEAIDIYEQTMELIDEIDWSGIPVSPIDYIHHRLREEGYKTNEITGRTDRIEYTADGEQNYQTRTSKERNDSSAIGYVNAFNSGDLDVIILNRSGSTGLSLHASERFADQRPRRMIIAQPELDINQFMQMIGRVHRTGQIELPRYTILMGDIPAEKRPAAVLMKKMASLNANTTAARENGFTMENVIDFMNDYGDQVVCDILAGNPRLNRKLGSPISGIDSDDSSEADVERLDTEGAINKVTGRIPLLPIAEQEKVYALITQEYLELVEREQAMGNSVLEAETLDLDARTLARMDVMPRKQDTQNVFGAAVYLEVIDAKSHRKPASQIEVVNAVRQELGMEQVKDLATHDPDFMMRVARNQRTQEIQEFNYRVDQYRQKGVQLARRVLAEYPEGEVPGEVFTKVADRIQKFESKLERQATHVRNTMSRLLPGESVRLVNEKDGSIYYGVVEKLIDKTNSNPAMPSTWKIQIQVADSARQITLPLSKVNTGSSSGMQVELARTDAWGKDVYQMFDDRSAGNREQRQVFTGNVIRAFEKFKGKLINYTDSQGGVQQGLLMPKGFDIQEELDKQPVRIPTVLDAERFMFEVTRGTGQLKTADESLIVRPTRDGSIQLITEKARSEGGRYFMDAGLIAASNGVEFYSSGSQMSKQVGADDVSSTLEYLYENYGGLLAFEGREKAREMLGLDLPAFMDMAEQNEQQGSVLETIADIQARQEIIQPPVVGAVTSDVRQSLEALYEGAQFEMTEPEVSDPPLLTTYLEQLSHVELDELFANTGFVDREQLDDFLDEHEVQLLMAISDGKSFSEAVTQLTQEIKAELDTLMMQGGFSSRRKVAEFMEAYEDAIARAMSEQDTTFVEAVVSVVEAERAKQSPVQSEAIGDAISNASERPPEATAAPEIPLHSTYAAMFFVEAGMDLSKTKDFALTLDDPNKTGDRLSVMFYTMKFQSLGGQSSELQQTISFRSLGEGKEEFMLRADQEFRLLDTQKLGDDRVAELLEGWIKSGYPQELQKTIEHEQKFQQGMTDSVNGESIEEAPEIETPLESSNDSAQVPETTAAPEVPLHSTYAALFFTEAGMDLSKTKDFALTLDDPKGSCDRLTVRLYTLELHSLSDDSVKLDQTVSFKLARDGIDEFYFSVPEFQLLDMYRLGNDRVAELLQSFIENGYPQELQRIIEQEQAPQQETVASEVEESIASAAVAEPEETKQTPVELAHELLETAVVQSVSDGVPLHETIQQVVQQHSESELSIETGAIEDHDRESDQKAPVLSVVEPSIAPKPEAVVGSVSDGVPLVEAMQPIEPETTNSAAVMEPETVEPKRPENVIPLFSENKTHHEIESLQTSSSPEVESTFQDSTLQEFGVSAMELTRQVLAQHDPATLKALEATDPSERYSPSLGEMREWMDAAKVLKKENNYTKRIAQLAGQMLDGSDEIFKPFSERDTTFRNDAFTLSEAASKAMHKDIAVSRNQQVAVIARELLDALGQQDGQGNVVFERPNGNYTLSLNSATNDLTIESKAQGGNVILQEKNGAIEHEASLVTATDLNTFKAFSSKVKEAQATKKQSIPRPVMKQAAGR